MPIGEFFVRTAGKFGDGPAVGLGALRVSYKTLTQFANGYANVLQEVDGNKAAILMPHCLDAFAAILGCCLAGVTFTIINVDDPSSLIVTKLSQFKPDSIICDDNIASKLSENKDKIIPKPKPSEHLKYPISNKSDVMYISWTSGSMGVPKGVKVPFDGFLHFMIWAKENLQLDNGKVWGEVAPLSYDLCIVNFFISLLNGLCFVPATKSLDKLFLPRFIRDNNVTHMRLVPTTLELMLESNSISFENLKSIQLIGFGGDKLLPDLLRKLFLHFPDIKVFNSYGLTETTGFNSWCTIDINSLENYCADNYVSISRPVPGWHLELDSKTSELVIASKYLGLGYLDPSLPGFGFEEVDGIILRTFRTGDIARTINGNYYIIGRIDRQVKVSGIKVHLDQIDSIISKAIGVRSFTCVIQEKLVTFIQSSKHIGLSDLIKKTGNEIPSWMLPKEICHLKRFPLNANGKVSQPELIALYNKTK